VFTKSTESYAAHHFKLLRRDGVPLCICTDDTWVFKTTLSRECAIAHAHFGLTLEDIRSIMADAVRFSFVEAPVKTKLLARIQGASAT
jgi:adenosine deaminase